MKNSIIGLLFIIFTTPSMAATFCFNQANAEGDNYQVKTGFGKYDVNIVPLNQDVDQFMNNAVKSKRSFCVRGTSAPLKIGAAKTMFSTRLDAIKFIFAYEAYKQ